MSYILNIETTTTNCSVSLSHKGNTLILKEDQSNTYSHAEKLHVFIEDTLKKAKIKKNLLSAIAVSKGPGSYTGLRIGVSAAKGLCFALDIPLISVSTLQALAYQLRLKDDIIIPVLDARRMEVYSAVFDSQYKQIRKIKAEAINEHSFLKYIKEKKQVYFIGNAAEKVKNSIPDYKNVFFKNSMPSAKQMSIISYKKHMNNTFEDVAYFEPFYLKDFIALKPKSQSQ